MHFIDLIVLFIDELKYNVRKFFLILEQLKYDINN